VTRAQRGSATSARERSAHSSYESERLAQHRRDGLVEIDEALLGELHDPGAEGGLGDGGGPGDGRAFHGAIGGLGAQAVGGAPGDAAVVDDGDLHAGDVVLGDQRARDGVGGGVRDGGAVEAAQRGGGLRGQRWCNDGEGREEEQTGPRHGSLDEGMAPLRGWRGTVSFGGPEPLTTESTEGTENGGELPLGGRGGEIRPPRAFPSCCCRSPLFSVCSVSSVVNAVQSRADTSRRAVDAVRRKHRRSSTLYSAPPL
jgi:hypothetical protein